MVIPGVETRLVVPNPPLRVRIVLDDELLAICPLCGSMRLVSSTIRGQAVLRCEVCGWQKPQSKGVDRIVYL